MAEYIVGIAEDSVQDVDRLHREYAVNGMIVRCKNCKHRDPEDGRCDSGHGIRWNLPRQNDWFCADGERWKR